jgi:hypothetical protein
VGAILLATTAIWAEEPLRVGEVFPITIDSTGELGLESKATPTGRIWELRHPDATYIALHFSRYDIAPGDRVFVSDPAGGQRTLVPWRGTEEDGTFWAPHVKGDTLILEYVASARSASAQGSAFEVDEYAAGFVGLGGGLEAICGTDDKKNAICYSSSHPVPYQRSQAVARLLIMGRYLCTGWLVSQDNLLLTNEHCITKEREAFNTDYEFDAEATFCDSTNCQMCWEGVVYSGAEFIRDNPALDYALIRLAGDPAGTYGWLEIDERPASVGEQIYMPQHPAGYARELGIEDSSVTGGVCRVASVSAPACTGVTTYYDVGYTCDTEGGSSGSPVLAASTDKVIALHHCGTCLNRGVPITLIYDEIAQYLTPPSCGDGTCAAPENQCSCPEDCGVPPATESSCSDGVDNDCDTLIDCDDGDCDGDPSCESSCGAPGDPCSSAADCCSFKCVGRPGSKSCK